VIAEHPVLGDLASGPLPRIGFMHFRACGVNLGA
jgi:hypothetical protein